MIDVRPARPEAPRGVSILIFGTGESAMSILAAGLARHARSTFGWANCSGTTDGLEFVALQLLRENSDSGRASRVDPRELTAPPPYQDELGRIVVPETLPPAERSRLDNYLALPLLLQRLLASARAPEGRTILLLTNLDSLDPRITEAALSRPEVHEILRREHVSLVATYRGVPPARLLDVFDRAYRTDSVAGSAWDETGVTMVRGAGRTGAPSPAPLRELLPWLGLTPDPTSERGTGSRRFLR
jgi:hypothetical protein